MDFSKLKYYVLFLFLFFVAQSLSLWGQFVTIPFSNISVWEAYKMAIPFAWLNWIAMTNAISIAHFHNLFTPTETTLLIILTHLVLVLLINKFYLKMDIYISDIVAFFIILFGFFTSYLNFVSKAFNIPIPEIYKEIQEHPELLDDISKNTDDKKNDTNKDKQ
jgi:hypothetical protein